MTKLIGFWFVKKRVEIGCKQIVLKKKSLQDGNRNLEKTRVLKSLLFRNIQQVIFQVFFFFSARQQELYNSNYKAIYVSSYISQYGHLDV